MSVASERRGEHSEEYRGWTHLEFTHAAPERAFHVGLLCADMGDCDDMKDVRNFHRPLFCRPAPPLSLSLSQNKPAKFRIAFCRKPINSASNSLTEKGFFVTPVH